EEAEAAWGEALTRGKEEPSLHLGAAWAALTRGDWGAAAARLERAGALWGERRPPAWYQAAVLAAAGADDPAGALGLARDGLAAHPGHPVLLNSLGVLLELSGEMAEAESAIRAAFAEAPGLPQASKNLGDLLYRAGRYDDAL